MDKIEVPSAQNGSYSHYLKRRLMLWGNWRGLDETPERDEAQRFLSINPKLDAYRFVESLEIPTVEYQEFANIHEAMSGKRAEKFVIKPKSGHSSAGVFLLTRDPEQGYKCAMTGKYYANDDAVIRAFLTEKANKPKNISRDEIIVENMVEDCLGFDVPLDYKVYAFQSGTPMVMQRYGPRFLKGEWAFAFYNENGDDLGPIRSGTTRDSRWGLRPPKNLDQIFSISRKLIAATQVSFLRIDLFSTPTGVIFGEFTPAPNGGKEFFTPEWEAILGDHWRRSLQQLGLDYSAFR